MGAILIKANSKSLKLIKEFAIKFEVQVTDIKDAQYDSSTTLTIRIGRLMDAEKTGTTVSRAKIMNKLNPK
jgi:hypothetical protein